MLYGRMLDVFKMMTFNEETANPQNIPQARFIAQIWSHLSKKDRGWEGQNEEQFGSF